MRRWGEWIWSESWEIILWGSSGVGLSPDMAQILPNVDVPCMIWEHNSKVSQSLF